MYQITHKHRSRFANQCWELMKDIATQIYNDPNMVVINNTYYCNCCDIKIDNLDDFSAIIDIARKYYIARCYKTSRDQCDVCLRPGTCGGTIDIYCKPNWKTKMSICNACKYPVSVNYHNYKFKHITTSKLMLIEHIPRELVNIIIGLINRKAFIHI